MSERLPIVLVDDDPDFLDMERSILTAGGYAVTCHSDPRVAFETLARTAAADLPRLVVTDLMMVSLDAGFTLARAIKADPRLSSLKVIIVSAVASQRGFDFHARGPEDLAAMGADAFFDKPVDPAALLARVKELLA
jgi:CheY-like chemotaxis protein